MISHWLRRVTIIIIIIILPLETGSSELQKPDLETNCMKMENVRACNGNKMLWGPSSTEKLKQSKTKATKEEKKRWKNND